MNNKLTKYIQKRNFKKTEEPEGKIKKSNKQLRFVVQHHIARKDHYDLRLEWNGTMKSWAIPKGPSYNIKDKRLAILVEDHPLDYRNFEGTIPKGQYGGGTVMIWDEGYWLPTNDPKIGLQKGSLKFELEGRRLQGKWTLVRMNDDNWILRKEKDWLYEYDIDINLFTTSIRTNRTMDEITEGKKAKPLKIKAKKTIKKEIEDQCIIDGITISNPDKFLFENPNITKKEIALYYQQVASRMFPYVKNRLLSTVRSPDGMTGERFFKKHFDAKLNPGLKMIEIANDSNEKEDFYYIHKENAMVAELQMNGIEFHIGGSNIKNLDKPNMLVFDLDPDEGMGLKEIRQGVKDLKKLLDDLSLISFLKTSGGKGYHIVIPMTKLNNWDDFRDFAKNIAKVMEEKWPNRYTSNVRKENRKGKIFIDWIRNTKGSSSVAPYSLRIRKNAPVSMPIKWSELDKIAPDSITMNEAIKRLKRKDPWEGIFDIRQ